MERDDVKRRRIMELAIVERVKQGLPLQKDALAYLINHFDLESLNRFCSTSWTMQQFCKENQVWRKKFQRHLPGVGNWLSSITQDQWIHYWNFLSSTRCPDQYRLLVAFLSVFRKITSFINWKVDVDFHLDIDFGSQDYLERILDSPIVIEDEIGFVVPIVLSCTVEAMDENGEMGDVYFEEDAVDILDVTDEMGWKTEFYDYDHSNSQIQEMAIIIPNNVPRDAVTIAYKLIGLGYFPDNFIFKSITAQIGACVQCERPKAKTVCGLCEQVAYCGQECANKHWENHDCAAK